MFEPTGNSSSARIFAMMIDNVLSIFCGMIVVAVFPSSNSILQGSIFCFVYLAYYLIPEAIWGKTLGKRINKLIVCTYDGKKAGLRPAILRTLLRIIEVNPLLLGALPGGLAVILSKRKQRFGDMLAGTVVIFEEKANELSGGEHITADSSSGPRSSPATGR